MRALEDGSVQLILTDPPFFHDNMEYDRLAGFYASWDHGGLKSRVGRPLQLSSGEGEFANRLARVFRECSRVIALNGLIAFTFAHARASGWKALDDALATSGLWITAAIPVEAEGSNGFHSHPGNLKWNGLFICRKSKPRTPFDARPLLGATKDQSVSEADRTNLSRALAVARKHTARG
jgi:adenine-specific DNA methylase